MPLNCSELTTSLKSLKSLQSRLNQQIEEFESVKDNEESARADKIVMLKEIWQTRKGIIEKINEIKDSTILSLEEIEEQFGNPNHVEYFWR